VSGAARICQRYKSGTAETVCVLDFRFVKNKSSMTLWVRSATVADNNFTNNYNGRIVSDTITTSGVYDITVYGAQGGAARGGAGGLGAAVSGDIFLQAGTVLEIVVGGEGANGKYAGGGGGGSFVIETYDGSNAVDTILAVAGGGGGAGSHGAGGAGRSVASGGNGGGYGPGPGGVGPAPGKGGDDGGGGGGYTGGAGSRGRAGTPGGDSGKTFLGGIPSGPSAGRGGFGGGGGGGYSGGGGGGGYGGGGGGGYADSDGGGGGGSYLDSAFTNTSESGAAVYDNGVVGIDLVCYLSGTRIAVLEGEIAVEDLCPGDLVITAAGALWPIRWIGRQTVSTRFADPLRVLPIRIRAGAIAEDIPERDLLVSPDHAVLIGDILAHANALVNGTSIIRETNVPEILTYYHIEIAEHALILAEGLPAESFVDNVSRQQFDNWSEYQALGIHAAGIPEMDYPRAKSVRQVPRFIRARLAARAEVLLGQQDAAAA
jgi:hypothetical protein